MASPTRAGEDGPHDSGCLRSGIRAEPLRPGRLLGRRRDRRSTGSPAAHAVLDDSQPPVLPLVPRAARSTPASTPSTGTCATGRGDQAALHLRQPGHRHSADLHVCRAARPGRARSPARSPRSGSRRATGSSSTCRWCPRPSSRCSRARGIGAVHSVVFGGFAPAELAAAHRGRQADRHRRGELRHRAEPGRRVQADAGCRARPQQPQARVGHRPPAASRPAPRSASATPTGRRWTGTSSSPTPSRPTASRSRPPTRSTSSTPRARPAGPRASCATTAATPSRCAGRWRTSTTSAPATCGSRRATSAGSSGHSYIVYAPLLTGATTVLYEGKPVGTPDASAFWRVIADHGVKAMFTAPTAYRAIRREDPDGALMARPRPVRPCRRCSWPASGSTPTPTSGPPSGSACRSSTTGGRPRPGWPIAANLRGLEPMPIKPGSPSVPVPGYDVQVLDERGAAGARRRPRVRSASGCRCRPAPCPTLWQRRRALRRRLPRRPSTATTSPATAGCSTRTATSSSWAAPTTCSTSPGTGSRPGRSRQRSPGTRPSPSARSSGSPTSFKGQVPRGPRRRSRPGSTRAATASGSAPSSCSGCATRWARSPRLQPGRHRRRPAEDPLGQDPAQDHARDGRRQDADRAGHHRGRLGARRPGAGAPPRVAPRVSARGPRRRPCA